MEIINKKYHQLEQGSQEWHIHRDKCYNASDVPALLNCSPYTTRSQLLKQMATGEKPEVSSYQQKIFDDGHNNEALAIPIMEKILGIDLYSQVISGEIEGLLLSASYDGLDMIESVIVEHKSLNEKNIIQVESDELELMYRSQMEQQLFLCESERAVFVISKNGDENTLRHCEYASDPILRLDIINAWHQFDEDLKNYVHTPEIVAPVIADLMELPALDVQIHGGITNSNIEIYQQSAHKFIEEINTNLETDEDFAIAEKTVKFLKEAQDRIKLVKRQALSQTADIEAMFNTLDKMDSEFSSKRLELDKLVKAEKENQKNKICDDANQTLIKYIEQANKLLGDEYIIHKVNFRLAIKGKRTIESITNAADDALANEKIEVKRLLKIAELNLNYYNDAASEHLFLFMDIKMLIFKDNEAFILIVNGRITVHKAAEEKKRELEREQIKKDLEQKAIDDKKIEESVEADHESKQQQTDNDKMERKETDIKERADLTKKVHTLAATAAIKSKKCQHTYELPLESPRNSPIDSPRIVTIEQMADKIAVKFCNDNELSPDRIAVLKAFIIHGYRKILAQTEKETA